MPAVAYTVSGNIHIGKEWEPKIYLSLIPVFDDMNTASAELIVHMADISPDGSFVLKGENLPSAARVYRLHICKKGDPPATLFIGGREENHFHFIMDNNSDMVFKSDGLFRNAEISGHPANAPWLFLENKLDIWRRPPKVNSKVNRDTRRKKMEDFIFHFSDTCSYPIPAMFALGRLDLENLEMENPGFISNKLKIWAGQNSRSPYFLDLQKRVDILRHKSRRSGKSWLMEGLVVCGLILLFYFFRKKISERENPYRPENNLSIQERRVLGLLSEGKSNKEISQELHIEVSTVKSHVSKIYSKLGVRSRKEVVGKQFDSL